MQFYRFHPYLLFILDFGKKQTLCQHIQLLLTVFEFLPLYSSNMCNESWQFINNSILIFWFILISPEVLFQVACD